MTSLDLGLNLLPRHWGVIGGKPARAAAGGCLRAGQFVRLDWLSKLKHAPYLSS
ncbi:hypothetical protein ACFQBQ_16510 [Granulicella cerasi]|uniref:Uncharacterized protein n=1 Tax=Granulicella cerasi TaxID=741063 RepID=A0ABW1ZCM3_9BACT|nr:hypothetical protein [Granulicella cerasi]